MTQHAQNSYTKGAIESIAYIRGSSNEYRPVDCDARKKNELFGLLSNLTGNLPDWIISAFHTAVIPYKEFPVDSKSVREVCIYLLIYLKQFEQVKNLLRKDETLRFTDVRLWISKKWPIQHLVDDEADVRLTAEMIVRGIHYGYISKLTDLHIGQILETLYGEQKTWATLRVLQQMHVQNKGTSIGVLCMFNCLKVPDMLYLFCVHIDFDEGLAALYSNIRHKSAAISNHCIRTLVDLIFSVPNKLDDQTMVDQTSGLEKRDVLCALLYFCKYQQYKADNPLAIVVRDSTVLADNVKKGVARIL